MSHFISVPTAADELGLKPATISRYCREGLVPGAFKPKPGSPWRIPAGALAHIGEQPETDSLIAPRNARSRARRRTAA